MMTPTKNSLMPYCRDTGSTVPTSSSLLTAAPAVAAVRTMTERQTPQPWGWWLSSGDVRDSPSYVDPDPFLVMVSVTEPALAPASGACSASSRAFPGG